MMGNPAKDSGLISLRPRTQRLLLGPHCLSRMSSQLRSSGTRTTIFHQAALPPNIRQTGEVHITEIVDRLHHHAARFRVGGDPGKRYRQSICRPQKAEELWRSLIDIFGECHLAKVRLRSRHLTRSRRQGYSHARVERPVGYLSVSMLVSICSRAGMCCELTNIPPPTASKTLPSNELPPGRLGICTAVSRFVNSLADDRWICTAANNQWAGKVTKHGSRRTQVLSSTT